MMDESQEQERENKKLHGICMEQVVELPLSRHLKVRIMKVMDESFIHMEEAAIKRLRDLALQMMPGVPLAEAVPLTYGSSSNNMRMVSSTSKEASLGHSPSSVAVCCVAQCMRQYSLKCRQHCNLI
jgi:hypothetical protein